MLPFTKKIIVADDERVLVFKNEQLKQVLPAGQHLINRISNDIRLENHKVTAKGIEHPKLDFLLKNAVFANAVDVFTTTENEAGILYVDGRYKDVLGPDSRYVQWKDLFETRLERIDLDNSVALTAKQLTLLKTKGVIIEGTKRPVTYKTVPEGQHGLLFSNGKLDQILEKGQYAFWNFSGDIAIELCDMKQRLIEISGQEMLTKDRLSLRMNVIATFRVRDIATIVANIASANDYVYKNVQLALREVVGTRTLDALLENKDAITSTIQQQLQQTLADNGIQLESVGIKDVILPGDMKELLNQVVQAQKQAEANLIKRREETAATRSLSNTARMLADNPTLMRLKELETLEKVVSKIQTLNVSGGLDNVMNDLVKLRNTSNSGA